MKDIELSIRMKAVADMVTTKGVVADIGCDHAFVSIYLVKNNKAEKVIASDVRKGPCRIARNNIDAYGLADRIDLRLGDGLSTIAKDEADTIIIAGMGGMLINSILEAGINVVRNAKQLVLQPQSDVDKVRNYILSKGFTIASQDMVIDMGKYYTIINVKICNNTECVAAENAKGHEKDTCKVYSSFGRYLIDSKHPVLLQYLKERMRTNDEILQRLHSVETLKTNERFKELQEEQYIINKAIEMMNK